MPFGLLAESLGGAPGRPAWGAPSAPRVRTATARRTGWEGDFQNFSERLKDRRFRRSEYAFRPDRPPARQEIDIVTTYSFTSLDDPSATTGTFAQGINDSGEVVGYYDDSQGSHGFLLNGSFIAFTVATEGSQQGTNGDYNSQTVSTAEGINDSGQVVGSGFWQFYAEIGQFGGGASQFELFDSANDGFIASSTGGSFTDIQAPINGTVIQGTPSSVKTYAEGVNGQGDVVGYYTDGGGSHGYLAFAGSYAPNLNSHPNITEFDYPGIGGATFAEGVNDQEQVVGYFIGADPNQPSVSTAHGFLYNNGAFSYFDDPNAVNGTFAEDINNLDEIVGYYVDGNGFQHGFVFNQPAGTYTTVDVTGAKDTLIKGINNNGQLVGDYVDSSGKTHGFVASPPMPPPAAPTGLLLSPASDSGTQGDDITSIRVLTITGMGVAGDTVTLLDNTTVVGQGVVASNGQWSVTTPSLAPGSHTFTATQTQAFDGTSGASTPLTVTILPPAVPNDFDADGKSDIFWRDPTSGTDVVWTMNGSTVTGTQTLYNVPSGFSVAGMGDFNGDGATDVLWRNPTTGADQVWLMGGGSITASAAINSLPSAWTVADVADFNGDGDADVLLRNASTGANFIWTMNGDQISGGNEIYNVPSSWTIAGVGDFFGGTQPDILLRQASTGTNYIWQMSGTNITGGTLLDNADSSWSVAGLGDFNGDGTTDVLMRQASTGTNLVWTIHNGVVASSTVLPNAPSNWTVAAVADFNHDGTADILMRDATSGTNLLWTMQNGQISQSTVLNNLPSSWSVAEIGDFNGDGTPDILWHNSTSGANLVWTMSNGTIASSAPVNTVATTFAAVNNGHLTG
ncbi:MAG TPA: FG-GAP-like repeat-containing protein [Xanthobacteraceae bacterium]|nr:FG-GAP-like repeat-containing protein [Xanthobacteraceae bacterium]